MGRENWNKLTEVYENTTANLPQQYITKSDEIYPGRLLSLGMEGDDVTSLQKLLMVLAAKDPSVPPVEMTGIFDQATENAVKEIQKRDNITVNGAVGPLTCR